MFRANDNNNIQDFEFIEGFWGELKFIDDKTQVILSEIVIGGGWNLN